MVEISTGKRLIGEDAPMLSQLQDFLAQNPGWEIAETDDDDSDEDGDDDEGSLLQNRFHVCLTLMKCFIPNKMHFLIRKNTVCSYLKYKVGK